MLRLGYYVQQFRKSLHRIIPESTSVLASVIAGSAPVNVSDPAALELTARTKEMGRTGDGSRPLAGKTLRSLVSKQRLIWWRQKRVAPATARARWRRPWG